MNREDRAKKEKYAMFLNWSKRLSRNETELNKELEDMHNAFEAGNLAALYDTIALCGEIKIALPKWAHNGTLKIIGDAICGTTNTGKGRHARWKTQYKEDMIDFERYWEVVICKEKYGLTWEKSYETAELSLKARSSFAEGGMEAIAKSYKKYLKVENENPYRYYLSKTISIKNESSPLHLSDFDNSEKELFFELMAEVSKTIDNKAENLIKRRSRA